MATNRGLWAVIKRYQTLVLFGILMGSSSVFVACGSDDDPPPATGGKAGRGGTSGTGGRGGTAGTGDDARTNDATRSLEEEEEEAAE